MVSYITSVIEPGYIKDDFGALSFFRQHNMKMVLFARFRRFTWDSWDRERIPAQDYEARSKSRGNQLEIKPSVKNTGHPEHKLIY